MLKRTSLIAAILIVLLSSNHAPADFQVTASITSINGLAVTGSKFTDQFGNVLTLTSSSTGLSPMVGFTASVASPNFFVGDDQLTSTITITNLAGGSSLTFIETGGFSFSGSSYSFGMISLDHNLALSVNGTTDVFRTFILDGVTFKLSSYAAVASSGGISGEGSLNVSFQITPEPSSIALCGIAGIVGLAVTRVRRDRAAS